jgi:hypothetical protein
MSRGVMKRATVSGAAGGEENGSQSKSINSNHHENTTLYLLQIDFQQRDVSISTAL